MKRRLAIFCLFACVLASPSAANAASVSIQASGTVTGVVTVTGGAALTIQTPGRATGVVAALTTAANRVTARDYPYVYGGGHAQAGIASIGIKGPGYNGRRIGYDCSGSVAAVLSGAGLWPAGSGVPNDAGIIAQLLREHLIARGAGTGPVEVTLYDDPGVHIFMNIDGRFFGTSDGGGGGNPRGGAGWLNDGAPDAYTHIYRRYHFLPSVLKARTDAGHSFTFQLAPTLGEPAFAAGEQVSVGYEETAAGSLIATALTYPGATSATGTVVSVASDGSSLQIQTPASGIETFATTWGLLSGVQVGDTVTVTYAPATAGPVAVAVQVTAQPAPAPTPAPAPVGDPTPVPPAGGPVDGGPVSDGWSPRGR